MPVVLGVLMGSILGARLIATVAATRLQRLFVWVLVILAVEMLYSGFTGRLR